MKRVVFVGAILIAQAAAAGQWAPPAPPVVIYDAGDTRPLAPLATASGLGPDPGTVAARANQAPPPTLAIFPVKSALLTPGTEPARALDRPMPPLCLVGDDAQSLAWLASRRERLVRLGASCLAVSVADARAWHKIRAAAGPVPVTPAPGDDIAQTLGLRHYPVLVGPRGIGP